MSAPTIITGPRARHLVLHYARNVRTLHTIDADMGVTVEVFGDPENGAYEWLHRRGGQVVAHSDCGYGQAAIALRDGLNEYFGESDEATRSDLRDAAPDLLAACQRVLAHPSVELCDCGEPDCATTMLRAAIKKATGE